MNELLLHAQYLASHHTDRTAALSLADHYQELRGLTRFAALRHVGRIRREQRSARELAAAAHRLKPSTYGNMSIRVEIVGAAEVFDNNPLQIVLRPGSRSPVAYSCDWHGDDGHWSYWSIIVGARWVLARAAEFDKSAFDWDASYEPQYEHGPIG